MTENLPDPLKLEPVGVSSDGRRHYYDAQAEQKLVEACLQPGVSLAGVALRAGVNANLLRRWVIKLHQQKHNGAAATPVVESALPAFVPVIEISHADSQPEQPRLLRAGDEPVRTSPRLSAPSRLTDDVFALPDTGLPQPDEPARRKPLPAELLRQRIEYDLPEEQKVCPCCRNAMHRMGEEVSEQLHLEVKASVLQHVRFKYACLRVIEAHQSISTSVVSEGFRFECNSGATGSGTIVH